MSRFLWAVGVLFLACTSTFAQSTTGAILGVVQDPSGAAVPDSKVTVRNLETNATKESLTGSEGRFRLPLLPAGNYEVTVEKQGFGKHVQGPLVLRLNQEAEITVKLNVSSISETVSITADAPLLNTTNAEISTNFDTKRVMELPLSTNRNIVNLALSVPGVSQLSSGQSSFANSGSTGTDGGVSFSANGMRLRSNNFMLDGQDANDPSVGGLLQPLNNPDIVAEVRVITNQFAPEYGRAAGSVVNVVTKSGTNQFHGSAFWFHNDNKLNTRSNLEKNAGFVNSPFRVENQFGGTLGGPVIKDRTFFFGSYQKWTDRRFQAGTTLTGAPTEEGRRILNQVAGTRPSVRALLENLPAAQVARPDLRQPTFTLNGQSYTVPIGSLTNSAPQEYDDTQWSVRVDHRFSERHQLFGRYVDNDSLSQGTGQATPVGLTNLAPSIKRSALAGFTSTLGPTLFNELRLAYSRSFSETNAIDPAVAQRIPSIEVPELGLTGFNAATSRTAIGFGVNLPQFGTLNNYQIANTVGWLKGSHSMKFGLDFRRQEQFSYFFPTIRGRLEYPTLQNLVDDQANVAQINTALLGGERIQYYRYYDYFFFAQDEWRIRPNFTLTYGLRYESPGNPFANLAFYNARAVAANNNDERFRFTPVPPRDTNNWSPRLGVNYRFGQAPGALGWLTGESKLVLRAGYSRTYDLTFNNIALNVGSAFPFVVVNDAPVDASIQGRRPNAFGYIAGVVAGNLPPVSNPNQQTRTIVSNDFRSPYAEQVSVQLQRELPGEYVLAVGYVGTKGTALFMTVDGNPTVPGSNGTQRVNPALGVVRDRCNCTSSNYHSMQASLEKRLSRNFLFAAHYTWSAFIDGASEIFNPSNSGEVAVAQDSFNRDADRGRSSYDRPHRFTTNGVWELPLLREQGGVLGRILGGWQVNGFLTFQSGAAFSALNGADPGARLTGISGLVGNAIRPNVNTTLDLASMTVPQLREAGGARLFSAVTAANPIGNLGRNVLRADGIGRLDLGIIKNFRIVEGQSLQFRADFFNATNTLNYGIPEARINSANFLNQEGTDGGNRRIQLGLRYVF